MSDRSRYHGASAYWPMPMAGPTRSQVGLPSVPYGVKFEQIPLFYPRGSGWAWRPGPWLHWKGLLFIASEISGRAPERGPLANGTGHCSASGGIADCSARTRTTVQVRGRGTRALHDHPGRDGRGVPRWSLWLANLPVWLAPAGPAATAVTVLTQNYSWIQLSGSRRQE